MKNALDWETVVEYKGAAGNAAIRVTGLAEPITDHRRAAHLEVKRATMRMNSWS